MHKTLTKRQKEVLDFVKKFVDKKERPPTLEEIGNKLKLSAVSTVHQHIATLIEKGYLQKSGHYARDIDISEPGPMIKVPLLGTIAAGEPIEAIRQKEFIAVPQTKIPSNSKIYALRVVGSSMIDENINDGDIVLVKHQETADNGQKVVALIDNHEATLKKFYKEKGHIRLQPANRNMEPLIFRNGRDISIQGIVLDVVKNQTETLLKEIKLSPKISVPIPQQETATKRKLINNLNDLSASEWIPETVSVFVQKGLGSGHVDTKIERQHPAPFSFQDVGRLVRFFTKKNQLVLDPFCGVGSTLKACAVNDRRGVGIEIVKKYVDLTKERLKTELRDDLFGAINRDQKIVYGDALNEIRKIDDNLFDFIVTSPPYWNILTKVDHKAKQERVSQNLDTKYSNLKNDLGNIASYDEFLNIISGFFNDCGRILKPKKYMAIVVSDFRHRDRFYTFHTDLADRLEKGSFALKGITILYQKFKKIFPYGYPYSYVPNIHHQYILILQNRKENVNKK